MGILDDAIREHLELKRKHGASGDDLERLENEAFGPAERPGPETGEEALPHADETEGPETAGAPEDWADSIEDDSEEQPLPEADVEPISEELSPAEQARVEHSHLEDTVDHPAVPESMEDSAPAETAEPSAEPPEAAIFDQDDDAGDEEEDFGDLDLDLDLGDDEPSATAPTESAGPAEEDELEAPGGAPAPGTDEFLADDDDEDAVEDDDEDLLEETPEFLQDTPEDERLWFEQGAPKDFDFDDD